MFRIICDPSSGSIKCASLKLLVMFCVRSRCLAAWNLDCNMKRNVKFVRYNSKITNLDNNWCSGSGLTPVVCVADAARCSREFHVKFMWGSSEFHVKFMWSLCEVHVNFMRSSREFHVKSMWSSCEVQVKFIWRSCEFHVKFMWSSRFYCSIPKKFWSFSTGFLCESTQYEFSRKSIQWEPPW